MPILVNTSGAFNELLEERVTSLEEAVGIANEILEELLTKGVIEQNDNSE